MKTDECTITNVVIQTETIESGGHKATTKLYRAYFEVSTDGGLKHKAAVSTWDEDGWRMEQSEANTDMETYPVNSTTECLILDTTKWNYDDIYSSGKELITFQSKSSAITSFWTLIGFGLFVFFVGFVIFAITAFQNIIIPFARRKYYVRIEKTTPEYKSYDAL
jgi:hypothetical protein